MLNAPTWIPLENEGEVPSPALLVSPRTIEDNLRRMIAQAGGVDRLRPHVKTHKMPHIVALKRAHGIAKFKTSTIAEAEMCASEGAPDVMLAYQPVGPHVRRLVALVRAFPETRFSCLADNPATVIELNTAGEQGGVTLDVFLDLNVGMNRTGIAPGHEAAGLYKAIVNSPWLRARGLHAYDGHLVDPDRAERERNVESAFAPVLRLRAELQAAGIAVPTVVAGGTPTFLIHAQRPDVELGAGACVLWDFGEPEKSPWMDFENAAVLLARVISRPAPGMLCLDLGYKAVASEKPHPRVKLLGIDDAQFVNHSEEHLVVQTSQAENFPVGSVVYAIPRHICPTVALQTEVHVVTARRATGTWPITARVRKLSI